jgi:hypothetical protein
MEQKDADQESGVGHAAGRPMLLLVAWLWVAVPLIYGLSQLIMTARKLFM